MANANSTPLQDELNNWFIYKDGELYYRFNHGRRNHSKPAGSIYKNGYKVISYKGKRYLAHRLIYVYFHGYLSSNLDHINCNKLDNRIENLRKANHSQNAWNIGKTIRNKSGHKGICWRENKKHYEVTCQVNNKQYYLGVFKDIDLAVKTLHHFREKKLGIYSRNE
jgi:hypothetical protein